MSGMFELFETDANLERNGVEIDYGDFRVTVARAGNLNTEYNKTLARITAKYKRAIQSETLPEEKGQELLMEVFAEACIKHWECRTDAVKNTWEVGMDFGEKKLRPMSKENILEAFTRLPELFRDLSEQANKMALYRKHLVEADAGN